MTGILQGNLRRCEAAQLLISQTAKERNVDILILSEQLWDLREQDGWFSNTLGTSAIWVKGKPARRIQASGRGEDYAWVRVDSVTYVSVYLTPNCTMAVYEEKVGKLEDALTGLPGDFVVAGDMNARAVEWGMTTTDKRGRLLLEMAARLDLVVVNQGTTTTYRRPGFGYSIPDVTMTSDRISSRIRGWRVTEDYTASDHQHIVFERAV
ncbi:uncharacterized protein LOC131670739 [Phymastichus coffea]|nr:uncharacterized protein LOC131670739 [Phymastichus coffea]